MAYHFPLMPRMYMAIAQEDRHPVVEILAADAGDPAVLPVGDLPAQPRRADARDGDQQGARLHVQHVRGRPARAHQPGHPPPPGAAAGERPRAHQADEQPAAVDAGHAGAVLRRRDRHGRQHLPRRPRRRAHADAVDQRPQRRLLARRPAAPVPAADPGPRLRLRGGQRRGAVARAFVAAELDAPLLAVRRSAGLRPRPLHAAAPGQPQDPGLLRELYGDDAILCVANLSRSAQPVELDLARLQGPRAGGDDGPQRLPADDRPALPADAAGARLLLVPPGHRRCRPTGTSSAGRSRTWPCWCCSTAGTAFCSATLADRRDAVPWRIAMAIRDAGAVRAARSLLPRFDTRGTAPARSRWFEEHDEERARASTCSANGCSSRRTATCSRGSTPSWKWAAT
jgi:hypothetical protein